jgi:hypothetical protein
MVRVNTVRQRVPSVSLEELYWRIRPYLPIQTTRQDIEDDLFSKRTGFSSYNLGHEGK